MATIVVVCNSREIALDDETAALLERIWRDGGDHYEQAQDALLTAIRGSRRVEWSPTAKAAASLALNAWVDSEGAHLVPFPILDLNQELMRDLVAQPFGA